MKTDYFTSVEGLEKLLTDYKETFEMIDDYGQQLMQGILTTPDDYKICLDKMTGAYVSLEPLYTMAVAYKENEETREWVSLKRELESKAEKVVAASLDREASALVAMPRRIRGVLEGYVESCAKAIGTCQTQLKRIEFEIKSRNDKTNN
jgi:hypothetical protein